ncbi:MAG TPA: lamin tail domain-containing protein, partial [Pyrinomonadaceae bacterium]|nr:lamin tail domain-containing protein [Pyrinomonadaceae bacterium]
MQSPLRRITNTTEEGTSINPSLSGDGRIVAFESTEDIAGAGGFESFRAIRANVAVDPATFLQIGATRAPAPAISQDGSRIAFASKDNPLGTNADANSEVFLYDGAKLIQLTNTSPGDVANRVVNGNFLPSISDDGRYVGFSSNRDLAGQNADNNLEIFVFDTVALGVIQLTNSSGAVGASDAKISGNGAFVAYIRDAGTTASPNRDLLLQSRTGATPLRVLATGIQSLAMTHGRAISDDGTRVVWAAETTTNTTQVFLFDGRNNITRQITSLGSRATDVPLHPTISGDGSRIAFATRRSFLGNSDGSVDLYAFDLPSASFGRVTSGPSTATAEVVSSLNDDGSLIVFNYPRALSGISNPDFANNSEIYLAGTPSRPASGTLTVVNGASFGNEPATTEAVAPNSIAVARGSVLANSTERAEPSPSVNFPLTLGGTTVTVNGRPAQVIYVSPSQVNFLVPPETELGTAEVVVTNSDNFPSRGNVPSLRAAPGVFTFSGDGLGDGVVLDANTLLPAPFDPTSGNLRLIIFATGVRNGTDVSVNAGGRTLTLESIIASPTMPGLDEIHVLVPADLRGTGKVDLVVRADGRDSNPAAVNFTGDPKRDIVINEFLADPPDGTAGDANRDGVRSTSDDEFVELVNTTTHDIDISGYQILTRGTGAGDTIRHTFASGTILPACTAIVIFGGGNPAAENPAFGGAQILKASTGSLTLINSAGVITLRDQAATILNFVSYGGSTGVDGDANQSVTRSPDTTGAFTLHQSAAGSGGPLFSPGTRVNGSPFSPCTPIGRVEVSPLSATVEAGAQQQFTARAFDSNGNEVFGVIFVWQSSNTAAATIDQSGRATALAAGSSLIRATGRGVQSTPATLTVKPATPVLTSVSISPVSATSRVGEAQQFAAQAKDQFGQDFGGVTISFSSSNGAVATVDVASETSATGSATATITGRSSGAALITATANNGSTSVSSNPATLTIEPGAGQLVISEFRTRGPNGASDEFIEIYNPTLSTQTIGGLKIRASNSGGTVSDRVTIPAETTLLSGRHYLVTNNSANTGYSGAVPGNQTYGTGIADDGGIAITGSNGTSIIDAVGMNGGSAYKEGSTLAPLPNSVNQSYERKPGGSFGNGTDTNNNAADFILNATSSNPQNLDSPGLDLSTADLILTKTDSPDPVITGSELTYTITVFNNAPGTAQSVVVTDNLPASVTFVSCASTGGGVCGGAGNNRTISFSSLAGGSSATITIVVNVDAAPGTTIVNSASVTSATPGRVPRDNPSTSTLVQSPPSILNITDVTALEGNNGTKTLTFTVSSSNPAPAGGISFDIATQDNTATAAGNDYLARNLTAQIIPAGQQTYTFDVTVNGDLLAEPNETFFVNLTNVAGAGVADGQGQGTIQNDDTPNLVISQLYGGGGNSGATFTNDFVEIFNRGNTTVNFAVTPYSVQYAGATANFGSNKVDLTSGTIAPGKYFLLQLSSGGAVGAALPTPDASGSINLAATAGKVALVAGTTALNAASCPTGATVSDLVGYGTTADCFEGLNRAPAPSATAADFRKADGCTDTDDNAADFLVAAPAPRNSSSPAKDCNAPPLPSLAITNVSANEGNSGSTTFTFTVSLSAPAPAGGVTFDIATQDNTATVADADYVAKTLTSQTIVGGNLGYTFDVTVNGDLNIEPNESFFLNVTNVSGATVADGQGQGTILNDDTANLVISQVYAGGGNSGATFTNDFVEIFNRGNTTVNFAVTPYSIQYAGATANFGSNKADLTSGTIAPG